MGSGFDGEIVLARLSRLCHARTTTAGQNAYQSAELEGRRQVWLHIMNTCNMTDDEIEEAVRNGERREQGV